MAHFPGLHLCNTNQTSGRWLRVSNFARAVPCKTSSTDRGLSHSRLSKCSLKSPKFNCKVSGHETVAFSGLHADLKVGCSAPHKDEGRDVLLNRGYFATEQDKSSNKMGCILENMQGCKMRKRPRKVHKQWTYPKKPKAGIHMRYPSY